MHFNVFHWIPKDMLCIRKRSFRINFVLISIIIGTGMRTSKAHVATGLFCQILEIRQLQRIASDKFIHSVKETNTHTRNYRNKNDNFMTFIYLKVILF
jgi:hypothetical protein